MQNEKDDDMRRDDPLKWVDFFIHTMVMLVVQYLLGCAVFSFQHNPLFIVFLTSEIYITERYLHFSINQFSSKQLAYAVFVGTLLILFGFFFFVGVLPVSTVFHKFAYNQIRV